LQQLSPHARSPTILQTIDNEPVSCVKNAQDLVEKLKSEGKKDVEVKLSHEDSVFLVNFLITSSKWGWKRKAYIAAGAVAVGGVAVAGAPAALAYAGFTSSGTTVTVNVTVTSTLFTVSLCVNYPSSPWLL
jgi:hypothetical protein